MFIAVFICKPRYLVQYLVDIFCLLNDSCFHPIKYTFKNVYISCYYNILVSKNDRKYSKSIKFASRRIIKYSDTDLVDHSKFKSKCR